MAKLRNAAKTRTKPRTRGNSLLEDAADDTPNGCTKFIVNAVKNGINESGYAFFFPLLKSVTWDRATSEIEAIRLGLRISGTETLKYTIFLAFLEITGGLPAGSFPGSYETIEECVLREEVLLVLLSKLANLASDPIATDAAAAKSALLILAGALWEETCTFDRLQEWVFSIFIPLIRIAIRAYNEFHAGKTEGEIKEPAVCSPQKKRGGELGVLRRMRDYQLARKPAKLAKSWNREMSSVSDEDEAEDELGDYKDEVEVENEQEECEADVDVENEDSKATSSSSRTNTVTPPRPGKGKSAPWDVDFFWRNAVEDGVLLEPFVLKAKKRFIEAEGIPEDKKKLEAEARPHPRSPLGPRNLQADSSPDAGRTSVISLNGYRAPRGPPSSSPCGQPSSPVSLALSLRENLAL